MEKQQFILCKCTSYKHIPIEQQEKALGMVKQYGAKPLILDDLCESCASLGAEELPINSVLNKKNKTVTMACFPRGVKSLLNNIGIENIEVVNLRRKESEQLEEYLKKGGLCELPEKLKEKNTSPVPWFPVIDKDRCSNCKQCLNFCLFGVFTLNPEGVVEVTYPDKCKTNCPACARICPEVAIIFPKYNEAPINGGPIDDEEQERNKIEASKKEILGDDVYEGLRMRKEKRKEMLIKRKEIEQAYKEREEFTLNYKK